MSTVTDRKETVSGIVYVVGYGEGGYGDGYYGGGRKINNITDLVEFFDLAAANPEEYPLHELLETIAHLLYRTDVFIDELYEDRFIETASGQALEWIGEGVGVQPKSGEDDDTYRTRIKAGFARATSGGDFEDFAHVVLLVLDTTADNITLQTDENSASGVVEVVSPSETFDASPFTETGIVNQLNGALPAGHRVELIAEDTFQFYTSDTTEQTGEGFDTGKWSG